MRAQKRCNRLFKKTWKLTNSERSDNCPDVISSTSKVNRGIKIGAKTGTLTFAQASDFSASGIGTRNVASERPCHTGDKGAMQGVLGPDMIGNGEGGFFLHKIIQLALDPWMCTCWYLIDVCVLKCALTAHHGAVI